MAKAGDGWATSGRTIRHTMGEGLVVLGDWAVPSVVTMQYVGDKDAPDGKRWPDVSMRFEVRDGAAVCTEFRVESMKGERSIRSGDLRFFDLDALAELALTSSGYRRSGTGWEFGPGDEGFGTARNATRQAVHDLVEASYRDPAGELKEVARVYLDPAARRRPTESVKRVLGYGSRETASRKVKRAREQGFIPAVGASDAELDAAWVALNEGV